jgi:hypothetical protein
VVSNTVTRLALNTLVLFIVIAGLSLQVNPGMSGLRSKSMDPTVEVKCNSAGSPTMTGWGVIDTLIAGLAAVRDNEARQNETTAKTAVPNGARLRVLWLSAFISSVFRWAWRTLLVLDISLVESQVFLTSL